MVFTLFFLLPLLTPVHAEPKACSHSGGEESCNSEADDSSLLQTRVKVGNSAPTAGDMRPGSAEQLAPTPVPTPAPTPADGRCVPQGTATSYSSGVTHMTYNSLSGKTADIAYAIPSGTGPFPVFLYFPGTAICNNEPGPLQMVQAMMQRGFVSASVEYPSYQDYDKFNEKAKTVAVGNASAVGMLCALSQANCSLGIATAGYSQGSHLAVLLSLYEPRVTAAMGIAAGRRAHWGEGQKFIRYTDECDDAKIAPSLPKEKRRTVVVDKDEDFSRDSNGLANVAGALLNQKMLSGYDCGNSVNCFQSDGSGYFVISHKQIPPLPDGHALLGLGWHTAVYDWEKGTWSPWLWDGSQAWAMKNNLDWLAKTAQGQAYKNTSTPTTAPTTAPETSTTSAAGLAMTSAAGLASRTDKNSFIVAVTIVLLRVLPSRP